MDLCLALLGLAVTVAVALSCSWMLCNPEHARQIMVDGVRGLLALVRR